MLALGLLSAVLIAITSLFILGGKRVAHLQCNCGQDTLSVARLAAREQTSDRRHEHVPETVQDDPIQASCRQDCAKIGHAGTAAEELEQHDD